MTQAPTAVSTEGVITPPCAEGVVSKLLGRTAQAMAVARSVSLAGATPMSNRVLGGHAELMTPKQANLNSRQPLLAS